MKRKTLHLTLFTISRLPLINFINNKRFNKNVTVLNSAFALQVVESCNQHETCLKSKKVAPTSEDYQKSKQTISRGKLRCTKVQNNQKYNFPTFLHREGFANWIFLTRVFANISSKSTSDKKEGHLWELQVSLFLKNNVPHFDVPRHWWQAWQRDILWTLNEQTSTVCNQLFCQL